MSPHTAHPSLLQTGEMMGLTLQQGQRGSWGLGWGAQGMLWGHPETSRSAQRCLGVHRGTWGCLALLALGFVPPITLYPPLVVRTWQGRGWCSPGGKQPLSGCPLAKVVLG